MTYPLSDTFATAPGGGYTTPLGSMTATYNSTQQAIDISAPNAQSILRFNETASGDFWFEADLEFLTDPSARKHLGLWMTTGNGSEGYRFAHIDGAWSVTRWNSGFGDGAAVTGGLNDGATPIAGIVGVAVLLLRVGGVAEAMQLLTADAAPFVPRLYVWSQKSTEL